MFAAVTEVLAHGGARIGRQVLQGSGVGGRSRHHDGVLHGVGFFQSGNQLGDRGSFLSDGDVHAEELGFLISKIVESLLVDDGVDGDGGFASLSDQ